MRVLSRMTFIGCLLFFFFAVSIHVAANTAFAGPVQLETIVVSAPEEDEGDDTGETIDSKIMKTLKIVDLAETLSDELAVVSIGSVPIYS